MRVAGVSRPTQAVILAGGRGERLRPLTDRTPKPVIEFHGRPFLGYLLEMLREHGFERALVLVGYLADVVRERIGDGSRWGIEVSYSASAPENDTGCRIRLAERFLDPCFLLMYCDNYWPMRMDDMWRRFEASGSQGMITVYANANDHTRSNVRVGGDGFIEAYDRSRTTPGLAGVEIGYAIMTGPALAALPDGNVSFEATVYPELARRRQLFAYVTEHRYYSVGSLDVMPRTEVFLARRPAIVLDRDGVLNVRPPRARYVRSPEGFRWIPGAREALRLLAERGYRVIVVSNQAGIGRGAMTEADLDAIHERMRADAEAAGGRIDAVYHCPHDWGEGCPCRKPKPGLLFRAQRDFDLDLSRVAYVGDDERDAQAADAAGCRTALVTESRSLLDVARQIVREAEPAATRGRTESAR